MRVHVSDQRFGSWSCTGIAKCSDSVTEIPCWDIGLELLSLGEGLVQKGTVEVRYVSKQHLISSGIA